MPLIRPPARTPVQQLCYAILDRWQLDWTQYRLARTGKHHSLFLAADAWMTSENIDWPFSYLNICTVLHLDPYCIRRGMERLRQTPTKKCRLGPQGVLLPVGVYWQKKSRTKVFAVKFIENGKHRTVHYDTIAEAQAAHIAYRARATEAQTWQKSQ